MVVRWHTDRNSPKIKRMGEKLIPNRIRQAIGKVWCKLFKPFWILYYRYGSCCPPKKHYYKEWIKNSEKYEWEWLHYGEFCDPVCFPLPFKINCIGCHGCAFVPNPPLAPDKPRGPWKIYTSKTFNEQYARLFGKGALVNLLFNLEKHNEEVDKTKIAVKEKQTE